MVRRGIVSILEANKQLLLIPIRQKAKFEGWLKFELAHYLTQNGVADLGVESKREYNRSRTDLSFFWGGEPYGIELKTPNTNWQIGGVSSNGRPITKNIQSIVDDAMKLNSENGIVAFVLFPVPLLDRRWEAYLGRINEQTQLGISRNGNCELVEVNLDDHNACNLVVCTFRSRRFRNWT